MSFSALIFFVALFLYFTRSEQRWYNDGIMVERIKVIIGPTGFFISDEGEFKFLCVYIHTHIKFAIFEVSLYTDAVTVFPDKSRPRHQSLDSCDNVQLILPSPLSFFYLLSYTPHTLLFRARHNGSV